MRQATSKSHRGLRNTKTVYGTPAATSTTTHYLYSEDKQLLAEVNANGKLERQYIYLADMPIAVIDTPQGKPLSNEELPAQILLGLDLQIIVKSAWNALTSNDKVETTNWLHTNHLGAPEAVTDSQAQPIWQAAYPPFGGIITASLKTKEVFKQKFQMILRLPGQYEDTESGLFYNRQRYYDPARVEYLSPIRWARRMGRTVIPAFGFTGTNACYN